MELERRNSDHTFMLLMDKLNGMDKKLDDVTALVNKHEVDIASAKIIGKIAHFIGWPAFIAAIHNVWKNWS